MASKKKKKENKVSPCLITKKEKKNISKQLVDWTGAVMWSGKRDGEPRDLPMNTHQTSLKEYIKKGRSEFLK